MVLAVDHYDVFGAVPTEAERVALAPSTTVVGSITPVTLPLPDRMSYVPVYASPLLLSPPDELSEFTEQLESENPDSWSAETTLVAFPPSDGLRPSLSPRQGSPASPQISSPQARSSYSLSERLGEISPTATNRLLQRFADAKVAWPPSDIALLAIKDARVLELYAQVDSGEWKFVHSYKVLAASGGSGPKLRRGDKQVPEGVYGISFLNPNSRYHVSMRVNYPNAFDRQMASQDGRRDLGGDIMIHGKNSSAGCLAMGDQTAEELFVLAAQIGLSNVKVIIAPTDFRRNGVPSPKAGEPVWLPKLYTEVASAMTELKAPPSFSLLSFLGY